MFCRLTLEEYLWYERLEAGAAERLAKDYGILNPARYPRSLLEQQLGLNLKTDVSLADSNKRSNKSVLANDQFKVELDYILNSTWVR